MRISDWSSDVCSSDLSARRNSLPPAPPRSVAVSCQSPSARATSAHEPATQVAAVSSARSVISSASSTFISFSYCFGEGRVDPAAAKAQGFGQADAVGVARSEEHTSELQSLMRLSYAVFCLKK